MSKSRLLIVDDSIFIYEEMKRLLAESAFEIVGYAKTGKEALEIYDSVKPDVMTLDIILPDVDGLDMAKELLGRHPDARIVVISSLAYDDTKENAISIGAKSFIFKPLEKPVLIATLEEALNS